MGGWGNSDILRPALQSGGTIYNNMPSDMIAVMKPKTTYYGPTYNSTSTDVSSITDIMFIPSAKEIYNVNTYNTSSYYTPFWEYEGTGSAHNEQYQLFANKGITEKSLILQTVQPCAWLRTCHHGMYGDSDFQYIHLDGRMSDSRPTRTNGVTPCFCV